MRLFKILLSVVVVYNLAVFQSGLEAKPAKSCAKPYLEKIEKLEVAYVALQDELFVSKGKARGMLAVSLKEIRSEINSAFLKLKATCGENSSKEASYQAP